MRRLSVPFAACIVALALAIGVTAGAFWQRTGRAADDESNEVAYQRSGKGVRWLKSGSGAQIKLLVDKSNLGGPEVEIGELSLPVSYGKGLPHVHQSNEIFYVLSGKLGHTVKGELNVLEPGMIGIVRAGDVVAHSVLSDEPVKALVIWAPGGESENIVKRYGFRTEPIEGE